VTTEPGKTVEMRLRAAVDASQSGVLMIDAQGRIVLVNREVERLFGYSREELLGKPVELLVPEGMRRDHEAWRATFVADPRVRAMGVGRDLNGMRKDGVLVPVEIGLSPIVTEEGMFVLASIVDVTSRRRAEARFRIAVESSPNGMVMIDGDGRIVLVNREVERMFGYVRDDLLGVSIEKLVPHRFRERHPQHRVAYFADPSSRAMGAGRDLFGLRKDGTEFPVEIGLNPIESDEGLFVLGSIVDISARKGAEAERTRFEQQLRQSQKMEAIGTLAGGIAHDFNNILSAIVGYAEFVRDDLPPDSPSRADIGTLLGAAERGRDLVKKILTFSRRQEAARVPVELGTAVRDVTSLLRATLPASIHMRFTAPPTPPRVLADPTSLQQIVMNLATNAAHAMRDGGTLDIGVESFYVRDHLARARPSLREGMYGILSVRDSGHGIEPAVLERVFEPFFTTKEPGAGTGLGLSIVMAIMRDHDGLVEVESEVGRGTAVKCYFPAIDQEVQMDAHERVQAKRGRGERVLFVDDEAELARIGSRRLDELGYRAVCVTESLEALRLFEKDPTAFDIIVTDYLMPMLTGVELARRIRAVRADIPILVATGCVEDLPIADLKKLEPLHVLAKPPTQSELAAAMRMLLDANKSA
jgi:PAS domain S-box-containing protein